MKRSFRTIHLAIGLVLLLALPVLAAGPNVAKQVAGEADGGQPHGGDEKEFGRSSGEHGGLLGTSCSLRFRLRRRQHPVRWVTPTAGSCRHDSTVSFCVRWLW